ncbi:hypothetical protein [Alsobacter sp. R-9]
MTMGQHMRAPPAARLGDEIVGAPTPSRDLFLRAVAMCRRDPADCPVPLVRALDSEAWVDAALVLLDHSLPGTAHMAGRLPDGSAHVRLMLQCGPRKVAPLDTFREDGDIALALLEAIVRAVETPLH